MLIDIMFRFFPTPSDHVRRGAHGDPAGGGLARVSSGRAESSPLVTINSFHANQVSDHSNANCTLRTRILHVSLLICLAVAWRVFHVSSFFYFLFGLFVLSPYVVVCSCVSICAA